MDETDPRQLEETGARGDRQHVSWRGPLPAPRPGAPRRTERGKQSAVPPGPCHCPALAAGSNRRMAWCLRCLVQQGTELVNAAIPRLMTGATSGRISDPTQTRPWRRYKAFNKQTHRQRHSHAKPTEVRDDHAGYTVSATQGAATVSVADNDDPAEINIIVEDASATEWDMLVFRVRLS